jgi:hypothetical protein
MPGNDPEACATFVAANRLIADCFKAKAEELLAVAQSLEDVEQRLQLADLLAVVEERAALHESIAELQAREIGMKCYCPPRTSRPM